MCQIPYFFLHVFLINDLLNSFLFYVDIPVKLISFNNEDNVIGIERFVCQVDAFINLYSYNLHINPV